MIKKNGIRLTRRTKSIKQDSHTPLQRMHGYRCRRIIDGLHTGIKNARMRCNRTELAVPFDMLKT